MADRLRISAKKLGGLAMADFCPRCFWIRNHMHGEPPFSVFPRVFNDIDIYTKRHVHGYFDEKGEAPAWLSPLGELTGYIPPPKPAVFQKPMGDNVLLTGEADAIYTKSDGTLIIADYKTAYCQGIDDPLYPIYKVQLNAYAVLAEHLNLGKVSGLALLYAEPACGSAAANLAVNRRTDGYALGFQVKILMIPLDMPIVAKLAAKAWEVHSEYSSPEGTAGCNNCAQMEELLAATKKVTLPYSMLK